MSISTKAVEEWWQQFVEDVANGQISLTEIIASFPVKPDDYFGHVQRMRIFMMLMHTDIRIVRRMLVDSIGQIARLEGFEGEAKVKVKAEMTSKEASRRFAKMVRLREEMANSNPSLLQGTTFEECLAQYRKIMAYLEQLWTDSRDHYRRGHYPLATFTALLLLEEMGKIGPIGHELIAYDIPRSSSKRLQGIGRDHRQKAFMSVAAGALINARLDRILGVRAVRQVLQDAESGELEKVRQACLYIDHVDGVVKTPGERIDQRKAEFFVVLAGEIWAETYGHFPFEWERMIELEHVHADWNRCHAKIAGANRPPSTIRRSPVERTGVAVCFGSVGRPIRRIYGRGFSPRQMTARRSGGSRFCCA